MDQNTDSRIAALRGALAALALLALLALFVTGGLPTRQPGG
jgi:hypothetical protein